MAPGFKSLLALVGAVAMVGGAVVVRGLLDDKEVRDSLVLRLVCATEVADLCDVAAKADPRVKAKVESPDVTAKRLSSLGPADDSGLDAWLTVGPRGLMVDSGRIGFGAVFGGSIRPLASTPIVLAFASGAGELAKCGPMPNVACVATGKAGGFRPRLDDPSISGAGLAVIAQVVMGATGRPPEDLSSQDVQPGTPGGLALEALRRNREPGAPNIGQLVSGLGLGNPNLTTAAFVGETNRAETVTAAPAVSAVAQLAVRDRALEPVVDVIAPKLAEALAAKRWVVPAALSGLPQPGVLAVVQEAWVNA